MTDVPRRLTRPRSRTGAPAPLMSRPTETGDVFERHGAKMAAWAARLLGPGADVDDVVQEVFLVVQRRLPEFRGDARITTWLYEITLRVACRFRRRARVRRWLGLGEAARRGALVSDRPGPLQALEARQATETVYAVLERLRERDRTLLILFEIERLSGEEIAALSGTSVGNVWVRLHRARARFLRAYHAWEQEKGRRQRR